MSQSILQNGYAILLNNTSDLDNHLLAKTQLLQNISKVKQRKTADRDAAIAYREEQSKKIDAHISKLLLEGTDMDAVSQYTNLKIKLDKQIAQLKLSNVNATYDDVRQTHAFFVNRTFKPIVSVAYAYSTARTTTLPIFGSSSTIKIPINGDFIIDQALHIRLSALQATHKDNKIRWFDFIGHRLVKEIRLCCDGIVLDRYGTEEMEMYYKFHVSKNQKMGWQRCVGQETPTMGIFLQDPYNQEVREKKLIFDGLQTQKNRHEPYDMYIPLLFWFNTNPAFAISNWNITYEKFYIEMDFETADRCVQIIDYANDGGKYQQPRIEACELITNHVYTIPEVAELFKHRMQFNIVRVHRRLEQLLDKDSDLISISNIKFAVESMYMRFRPTNNDQDPNAAEVWRKNNIPTYKEVKYASIIQTGTTTSLAYTPMYYYDMAPAIDSIALESQGNAIYEYNPGIFYNSYIPLRFGGETIMTPDEEDAYLMTFSIYPGDQQPSGYLNFSQSRDQYLAYSSSYIDSNHQVSMVICATCINFLVLMDGAISIRYAT